ncbi:MAG: ABC transporter ATP-binding protein [Bacilli bacterium]|nr:ABC transporter ATP-binding protein [Bacilli bacterium]
MKKVLEINHLKKYYHTEDREIFALKDISFDVNHGEFISIVGPSGCGKSTILSILANIENKSDGSINIEQNKKIAYMLQDDSLLPFRTVLENSLLGLEFEHNLTKENKEYVLKLLDTYGLKDFINQYPKELSGGMRQRVALIRTLAVNPDIILLDEAMSSLDYQTRLRIGEDLYKIIKKEKKTAIMVTHDIGEAISMSDRVIVLTNRPSTVKNIYEIKLKEKKNPIDNRSDPNFSKYFNQIWRDLYEDI